jgi:acylphosphatase
MSAVSITISGKVQGVFFRKHVQKLACTLNITGFVRNNINGSVYIEALGEEEQLKKLIEWCAAGPAAAKVEHAEVRDIEPGQYAGFEIRRTQ